MKTGVVISHLHRELLTLKRRCEYNPLNIDEK